jgi:hypothetical protein
MNWKTTTLGILTILGSVASIGKGILAGEPVDFAFHLAAITAGLGLVVARDASSK